MPKNPIRAFIGIALDTDTNRYLDQTLPPLQSRLQAATIRWIKPHNRHLTLVFLGQVDAQIARLLQNCLTPQLTATAPFKVPLSRLGPLRGNRSGVIAAFADATPELLKLYQCVKNCCIQQKLLPRDNRPLRPHITVGRYRPDRYSQPQKPAIATSLTLKLEAELTVYNLSIYQSTPSPEGSEYRALQTLPLTDGETG